MARNERGRENRFYLERRKLADSGKDLQRSSGVQPYNTTPDEHYAAALRKI